MRKITWVAPLAWTLACVTTARADVVTDWNAKVVEAGYVQKLRPDVHARAMAIMHIAMFEAVNSVEPRYAPYRSRLPAEPGASRDAAAHAAAHATLLQLIPDRAAEIDAMYAEALAKMADDSARARGIRVGEAAAAAILAERRDDGSANASDYRPHTTPGRYVPTAMPVSSTWGSVRPFGMTKPDQFRPPAPYALSSAQWAKDYDEIRRLGRKTRSERTVAQTDVARFWQVIGPITYNPVAVQVSAARKLDVVDNARLFALSGIATADAAIAVFDAKFTYNFWRPVTAIRNGDLDGNDATERDATWEPFIVTPMHPEYPCAHCIFQGAQASVLRELYGETVPRFTVTSAAAPDVQRSFERLTDYVNDVIDGRVWEGVHYRTSGEVGARMGREIGAYTVRTYLRPAAP